MPLIACVSESLCSGSVIGCNYDDGPLFYSRIDNRFITCVNRELFHSVAGQYVYYYRIAEKETQVNFYNESKQKVFYNPIKLFARVEWEEPTQTIDIFTLDEKSHLIVYFDKFDLSKESINLKPTVGDFVKWNDRMFEILSAIEWQPIFGTAGDNLLIKCTCGYSREGQFDEK